MPFRAPRAEPEEGGKRRKAPSPKAPSPLGPAEKRERGGSYRSAWVEKSGGGSSGRGELIPSAALSVGGRFRAWNFRTSELQTLPELQNF